MELAQTETQNENFHRRMCFMDPAFVKHLHSGCRKDSNKQLAAYDSSASYCAAAIEIHIIFDSLEYLLYDAYSNYNIALVCFSIKNRNLPMTSLRKESSVENALQVNESSSSYYYYLYRAL
jgi:hypothetical protein